MSCYLISGCHRNRGWSDAYGVDAILYNDEAIYVWVQRQLDDGLIVDDYTLSILETAFIELVTAYTDQAA